MMGDLYYRSTFWPKRYNLVSVVFPIVHSRPATIPKSFSNSYRASTYIRVIERLLPLLLPQISDISPSQKGIFSPFIHASVTQRTESVLQHLTAHTKYLQLFANLQNETLLCLPTLRPQSRQFRLWEFLLRVLRLHLVCLPAKVDRFLNRRQVQQA